MAITVVVFLAGIAIATAFLIPLAQGQVPNWSTVLATWDWLIAVILVILTVGLLLWITRLALWGPGGPPPGYRHHHHRRDEFMDAPASDAAVEIARGRYARGEISGDELDRLLAQLGRSSPGRREV